MSKEIENAMKVLTEAMQDTELGSYAHCWHCNIAMMCYDAMLSSEDNFATHEEAHKVGNDAASRFMKILFNVDTSNENRKDSE